MKYSDGQVRVGTRKFSSVRSKTAISYTNWSVTTPRDDNELLIALGRDFYDYIEQAKKAIQNNENVVILEDVYTDKKTYQVCRRYAELSINDSIIGTVGKNDNVTYL
ncbi:hypothetical protein [Francisella hispaniensis]|uniref:Uncharacterized protein n=1 Tax=Francisella hispaniensis TaxID=622488 RepID=F4BFQ3_9GAMM|nr:hypothetical protein [Francisella hispaniensis]AEE26297.1 hypothetical protein FN3523_0994 [Francisella hispaniensis]